MSDLFLLRVIIFIAVNSGGVGKTLIAEIFDAIAQLLNIEAQFASYDHGNHALRKSLGEKVIRIEGTPDFARGRKIIEDKFTAPLLVVDCGANSLFGPHAALGMGQGMQKQAQKEGHRFFSLSPAGAGKIGGLDSAINACRSMKDLDMNSRLILNDMNGSGSFGRESIPEGIPVDEIPHLPAAFQSMRVAYGMSIYDMIAQPKPGYEEAGRHTLAWLLKAAEAPIFKEVFGDHLEKLPAVSGGSTGVLFHVQTVEDVHNDRLIANGEMKPAFNAVLHGDSDDTALLQNARKLRDAYSRYCRS